LTERLSDVSGHIATVRQLGGVVNAMRGIAAARAQQGRALLPAARAYADVAAQAIGQALLLDDGVPPDLSWARVAPPGLIVFGAEQGFAGAFADTVLDGAAPAFAGANVLLVGSRAATLARGRDLAVAATFAAPLRAAAIAEVAGVLIEAVMAYVDETGARRIDMIFPVWTPGRGLKITRRSLLPLDLSRFATPRRKPPLVELPLPVLLERLTEEYVFAQICEAATESFAAENEARVSTMAAAGTNIDAKLAGLQALERMTRQEAVTAEVVELASGARSRRRH
jgi:F-type H+-transporting ATPase subunit gamma